MSERLGVKTRERYRLLVRLLHIFALEAVVVLLRLAAIRSRPWGSLLQSGVENKGSIGFVCSVRSRGDDWIAGCGGKRALVTVSLFFALLRPSGGWQGTLAAPGESQDDPPFGDWKL